EPVLQRADLRRGHPAEAEVLGAVALHVGEQWAHHPETLSVSAPRWWYSFTLYWILRGEICRISEAREVLPPTASRVRRMASRSMASSVLPGMEISPPFPVDAPSTWAAARRRVGKWEGLRVGTFLMTTARSMAFSSSRTLPGQGWRSSMVSTS